MMAKARSTEPGPNLRTVDAGLPLLGAEDGPPVEIVNPDGEAAVLLICEHASNRVPASLDQLGLDAETLTSHVAHDPGAAEVARHMAERLNAPLILQRFSRLVYDCNRPPDAPSAMPAKSEIYEICGNQNLSEADRLARTEAIYRPFHQAIAEHLDRAQASAMAPAIVTIHSFTPLFYGKARSVQLGLLHDADRRLADTMLDLALETGLPECRRNEPYGPEDGVTHTLQLHALPRNLLNVMIEIRNDLIRSDPDQIHFADGLSGLVARARELLKETRDASGRRQAG